MYKVNEVVFFNSEQFSVTTFEIAFYVQMILTTFHLQNNFYNVSADKVAEPTEEHKKKKKLKRIVISDDEGDDSDAADAKSDDDNEAESDVDEDREVMYDSEENEIEVEAESQKFKGFGKKGR